MEPGRVHRRVGRERSSLLHQIQKTLAERVRFGMIYDYVWPSGGGPKVAEPALLLIDPYPWVAAYEAAAPALRGYFCIARHTRSGRCSGISRCRTPNGLSASSTALTTAGVEPMVASSPTPFAPKE